MGTINLHLVHRGVCLVNATPRSWRTRAYVRNLFFIQYGRCTQLKFMVSL